MLGSGPLNTRLSSWNLHSASAKRRLGGLWDDANMGLGFSRVLAFGV